jgi:hypothetical protein
MVGLFSLQHVPVAIAAEFPRLKADMYQALSTERHCLNFWAFFSRPLIRGG